MTVFLHNSPFATDEPYCGNSASFQLPYPTADTRELIHHACLGLKRIFRQGFHYSKCGVMLTDLSPEGTNQLDLFSEGNTERTRLLMECVDSINRRLERDTLFYAGSGTNRAWAAFANRKSPSYTSDVRKVIRVRA